MREKGTGSISSAGYLRVFVYDPARGRKRLRMEHHVVWEAANGPIPEGCQIHHKDHDRLNNHLDNLVLTHSKMHHIEHHSDYYKVNGVWMRKCLDCRVELAKSVARHRRCQPCYNEYHKNYMTRTGRTNKFQYIAIRDVKGRIITRERLIAA